MKLNTNKLREVGILLGLTLASIFIVLLGIALGFIVGPIAIVAWLTDAKWFDKRVDVMVERNVAWFLFFVGSVVGFVLYFIALLGWLF